MIQVTRINGERFYINPDAIEFLEETPDTVVSLASGRKVVVAESAKDIERKIVVFRRRYLRQGHAYYQSSEEGAMEITTLSGIAAGIGLIVVGITLSGSVSNFIDLPSIMIVFGGTFASTVISFPVSQNQESHKGNRKSV